MGIMRRLAEVVLGPVVVRRGLPVESGGGFLVVSGQVGGMRYLLKPSRQWDPELLDVAHRLIRKGDVVWDIGSNVGLFAKAAAFHSGRNGRVLAIEPDCDAVALLNRTCRWHSEQHAVITVVPVVVSDSNGFVQFAIAKRARATNSIEGFGTTQTGGVAETRTLPCLTLDKLLEYFPVPNLIKIDVEAAEQKVFMGGDRVLQESRPVIHCEVSAASSVEVTRLLQRHSYRLWDASEVAQQLWREIDVATHNIVAIPSEKVTEMLPCQ